MQLFLKLFGRWLQLVYVCFDRVVIQGYLSFLMREENVVYFFREVGGVTKITKEVLRQRTEEYRRWVKAFADHQHIIMKWAPEKVRKEDIVGATLRRRQQRQEYGVYYILESMEQGSTYRVIDLKYATKDPNYAMVRRTRLRFTHFYFYILDKVAGPMVLRVGTYLPFAVTGYINGHSFIEQELRRQGAAFKKEENSFVAVGHPQRLQKAADKLDGKVIQKRLEYWTLIVGPKFSKRERAACRGLHRIWSVNQVEYCANFVFQRHWPIRRMFARCCELSLYLLTADRVSRIFGQRRRKQIQGKAVTVFQRLDSARHVFRCYWQNSLLKQYEKWQRFLRLEVLSNDLRRDFGLHKTLPYWAEIRERLAKVLDGFTGTQAQNFNVHGSFDLIAELAKPVRCGKSRVAGLRMDQLRPMRVLEVLVREVSGHLRRWTIKDLHAEILATFELKASAYKLSQLRYDLHKLRSHGIVERVPHSYAYRLPMAGHKQAILLIQFRERIFGPLAYGSLVHRPSKESMPDTRIERAYHKVEESIDDLVELLAA